MGKTPSFTYSFIPAVLLAILLTASLVGKGMSEEDKKKAFLKTRSTYTAVEGTTPPAPKASAPAKPASTPKSTPKKSVPKTATKQRSQSSRSKPTPRTTPTPTPARKTAAQSTPTPTSTPAPKPTPTPERAAKARVKVDRRGRAVPIPKQAIVVEKSGHGGSEEEPPPPPPKRGFRLFGGRSKKYKYLTPQVRAAIDRAKVRKNRWRFVVVHNSGTRQGSAKAFDYYHTRVRKMPNGLAYHFVIGNGTSSGNGHIEIGNRWTRQINGGHVHSDYLNDIALGICLVGDYNRDKPTKEQLEALDELTTYLRRRVGKTDRKYATVKAHKDINPRPTDCPGSKFPYRWLYTRFK